MAAFVLPYLQTFDLRQVALFREISVPGHPMHQPVDPLDMAVVQRTLRGRVAAEASRDELSIV